MKISHRINSGESLIKGSLEHFGFLQANELGEQFVHVWEIPHGLINAGQFEVTDFDGTGFATRVYSDGRVEKRGVTGGKMGWLEAKNA